MCVTKWLISRILGFGLDLALGKPEVVDYISTTTPPPYVP